jgi:hypothetical protein
MRKGEFKMKKLIFGTILLAVVHVFPIPAMAGVDVGVSISLPPLIVFAAPPEVVVIPETYVYAVPDINVDIFFYNGWWWRPWEGRWYRSRHYNSGWAYYRNVPYFYREIPSGWRNDYRDHRWKGHKWNYQRIPHQQVQGNWNNWEKNRHWEKQNTWGVQGLNPRTRSQQPYQKSNQNLMEISSIESRPNHSTHDRNLKQNPSTERSSHSTASHKTGKHNSNLNLGMENLIKGRKENRIKSKKRKT